MPGSAVVKDEPIRPVFDHADPSVLEEPTIPIVSDQIAWDNEWGSKMDYPLLDAFAAWRNADEEHARQFCAEFRTPYSAEPPSTIRLAVQILKFMEKRGIAPAKSWLSWNCVCTIAVSDWVFDYLESKGMKINRSEWAERLAAAKPKR